MNILTSSINWHDCIILSLSLTVFGSAEKAHALSSSSQNHPCHELLYIWVFDINKQLPFNSIVVICTKWLGFIGWFQSRANNNHLSVWVLERTRYGNEVLYALSSIVMIKVLMYYNFSIPEGFKIWFILVFMSYHFGVLLS